MHVQVSEYHRLPTILLLLLFFPDQDASALFNEQSMIESTASEENDASLRSKKDASLSAAQHFIPSPHRRHHLKFGVLGKRYAYGYLGKRNDGTRFHKKSKSFSTSVL